jgi:DNA-binding transcriptional ArsR family regulator
MERLEAQARLFKALMHPARLAILEALREDEHCVCHLEAALGYRQAYISQQLTVLREAGLVQDRRDGWNIYYRATEPQVFALLDQAAELAGLPAQAPRPAQQKPCPCPKCQAARVISLEETAPEPATRAR